MSRSLTRSIAAFFKKQKPVESGCILYTGGLRRNGYGTFGFGSKDILAHRFAYEMEHGAIPEGWLVMHTCDVRNCVNPDHLRLGTHRDNILDMMGKGRARFGQGSGRRISVDELALMDMMRDCGYSYYSIAKRYGYAQQAIKRRLDKLADLEPATQYVQ